MSQVEIRQKFSASPERVFAALSDHGSMGEWLGMRVSVPVQTPGGGVGTVRRVHAGPAHIDEEVLEHEPPHRLVYTIVSGLPGVRAHRGEVQVEGATGGGSEVRWQVRIDSSIPGYGALLASSVKIGLGRGLSRLARRLEG